MTLTHLHRSSAVDAQSNSNRLIQSALERFAHSSEQESHLNGGRLLEILATAVEQLPVGIVFTDPNQPDNPIFFANRKFSALTGYALNEVVGQNCRLLQGAETDPQAIAKIRQAVEQHEACEIEILNYRKNGEPFWNHVSIYPLFDAQSKLIAYIGIHNEITKQKHIENALSESNSKFSTLANVTSAGILILQNNRVVFANPAVASMLGYQKEEFSELSIHHILHPADKPWVFQHQKRQLTHGIQQDAYEVRLMRQDGTACWVYLTNGLIQYSGQPAFISTIFNLSDLKKAQEEAEMIERRLRTVIRHAPIIMFAINPEGIITLLEGQGAAPFVQQLDQIVGTSIFKLLPIPKIHEGFRMALQGISQQQSIDYRDFVFDVWYEPHYEDGKMVGIVGVAHNITRLKETEKRLQERIKFEQLLNVINATFLQRFGSLDEIDTQINQALAILGEYVGVDRSYIMLFDEEREGITLDYEWCAAGVFAHVSLFEYIPTAAIPWSFSQLIHGSVVKAHDIDSLPAEAAMEKAVAKQGAVKAFLLVPIESDRQVIGTVGFDKLEPISGWDDQQITALSLVSAVLSNILERRRDFAMLTQTHSALQAEEARTRAILFALPDAILVVDENGRYLDIHIPDQFSLKVDPQQLLGKLPHEVLPKELADLKLSTLKQALETLTIQEFEFTSGEKTFNIRISPINKSAAVIIQTDITERVIAAQSLADARDKAIEANQIKGQILAKVSHELRTPLGVILGYGELLKDGTYGPLESHQHEIIDEMVENALYLSTLVDELLDQSKLEHNQLTLLAQPFEVRSLLSNVLQQMSILAHRKNLTLRTEIDSKLPQFLLGDKQRIHQILVNLVGNAIKFSQTGEIRIDFQLIDQTHWSLEVSDSGPGIPYEAQAYIFEPFRQVDGSIKRQHGGTGLGLSIVKQLTQAMGGEVYLDSEPGKGSSFIVYLPLELPQGQAL